MYLMGDMAMSEKFPRSVKKPKMMGQPVGTHQMFPRGPKTKKMRIKISVRLLFELFPNSA